MNEHEEKHEPLKQPRRRRIKVRPYKDRARPTLHYVVGYRESGKRKRTFFETKEAAQSFALFKNAERERNGIEASEFPTSLRIMAQEAMEALRPFEGKTIRDAVAHYVAHLNASERSCTAEQLVKELLKAKKADGVGERHLNTLRSRLGYFADEFDGKMVAEITRANIDDWLRSLDVGAQTRNHYRAVLVSAFNFALRNGYAVENPAFGAAKAKVVSGRPGILTVEQASALLVQRSFGHFALLRYRLCSQDCDAPNSNARIGAKSISRATSFKSLPRKAKQPHADSSPCNRICGMVNCPTTSSRADCRPPETFRQSFKQTRAAAGITDWPKNALRHSFASYHLAAFKNAATTALELGHHDSRVTFAHYRELVKPKEAARLLAAQASGTLTQDRANGDAITFRLEGGKTLHL